MTLLAGEKVILRMKDTLDLLRISLGKRDSGPSTSSVGQAKFETFQDYYKKIARNLKGIAFNKEEAGI